MACLLLVMQPHSFCHCCKIIMSAIPFAIMSVRRVRVGGKWGEGKDKRIPHFFWEYL